MTTLIQTNDYSQSYGGVNAIINGNRCSFGSVKGYALYNKQDVEAAIARAMRLHHNLVWISLSATVLSSSRSYYEMEQAKWANAPRLSVGDVVEFEGGTYTIAPDYNDNFKLVAVQ